MVEGGGGPSLDVVAIFASGRNAGCHMIWVSRQHKDLVVAGVAIGRNFGVVAILVALSATHGMTSRQRKEIMVGHG